MRRHLLEVVDGLLDISGLGPFGMINTQFRRNTDAARRYK